MAWGILSAKYAVRNEKAKLPEEIKKRVHDIVMNSDKLRKHIRDYQVQDKISYGLGQVLMLYVVLAPFSFFGLNVS